MIASYFLPCLWAFLGCVGFAVIYNTRDLQIIWDALGGALGWFFYLILLYLSGSDLIASFAGAVAVGVFSEIMARVMRRTVTSFLLIGIFPMVPGAGIYYTMRYCVLGDTANFIATGVHTLGVAGALAIGIFVVASTWRLIRAGKRKLPVNLRR
ncbi:MAG: threonine/serine exporter family protein [Oscillospiraceae bacterium]|nr:threonine/serine exporter family protein [Oscillospiraceae bacterium]